MRNRHTCRHHRTTHERWKRRRFHLLHLLFPWANNLRPQDYADHITSHRLGKKHPDDRHHEEKHFRQAVRNVLHHDDVLPRYRHDWA